MTEAIVKTLAAYLFGTIMGGLILGRLRGADLRSVGSGNVGATNALRTQGKRFALAVLAIDIGKGILAVTLIPALPWPWPSGFVLPRDWQAYLCGFAAALGHVFPVWFGFRGGKGAATMAGIYVVLLPAAAAWMLAAFALTLALSGYVGLATIAAAVTALFQVTCFDPRGVFSATGVFTIAMGLFIILTHRSNIARMARGIEHRFEKAMVLRRWRSR